MYPNHYFSLFPPFPRNNKVFVAMSFDPQFTRRWDEVLKPAISRVRLRDQPLEPHRVDARRISDSILTEILGEISSCRLIIADISTIGYLESKPIRNANVLYEVGLAQACRLPEEVLLFRSDSDEILFDLSNVRLNKYSPEENPEEAINIVTNGIVDSLRELDLSRHLTVKNIAESLDVSCLNEIIFAIYYRSLHHYPSKTMGQVLSNSARNNAISQLLAMGVLQTEYMMMSAELLDPNSEDDSWKDTVRYRLTDLGTQVFIHILKKIYNPS